MGRQFGSPDKLFALAKSNDYVKEREQGKPYTPPNMQDIGMRRLKRLYRMQECGFFLIILSLLLWC
jgi:hypothetical protein